jgi:preprotein translocase subunit YajC
VFISNAYAQGAAAAGGDMSFIIMMVAMFGIMYFLMIRPQMKRAKEHKAMIDALQSGDEVIVAGMLGKVSKVGDSFVAVEIADNTTIRVQKSAVAQLMPKGTYKAAV